MSWKKTRLLLCINLLLRESPQSTSLSLLELGKVIFCSHSARQQLSSCSLNFNTERRKHINDIQAYIRECNKLQEELSQIVLQAKIRTLKELKINPETFEYSLDYHVKKEGNNDFLDKVAQLDRYITKIYRLFALFAVIQCP